jgi:integrase
MADLAVLELPKKKARAKRRARRGRGSVWLPTYKLAGDIKPRKSRFYWIRYTDESGRRHNEATNFSTKEGAEQVLTERLGRIDKGEFDLPTYRNVTLRNLTDAFRVQYVEKGRRTTAKLERSLARLEEFFGADRKVVGLTEADISAYRAHRLKQKRTQYPTVNRELAALKASFRLGLKQDKVRRVPDIVIQQEDSRAKDGEFSPEQLEKLLTELPGMLKPLATFISRTGMRIAEPLGMRWSEVNLDRGELRIPGRRTKNGDQKVLYLSGTPLNVLKEQHKLLKKAFPTCEYVFPNARGERLTYDQSHGPFLAACKRAKITFPTPDGSRQPGWHDLRRTFARWARLKGVADETIMEIAGWKTHAMLLRYLGAAKPDEQRAAFAKLDAN